MPKGISYQKTGYFSKIINDYLDENPKLNPFYNRFPNLENFQDQINEKKSNFNFDRKILIEEIQSQYAAISISDVCKENIKLLKNENTFTVTTGHQLNIFTGPIYFLYKIITTINLCNDLKIKYPVYNFVPIYWMASEDHDFDEINYFNFQNKKIQWKKNASGPVGRLDNKGLDVVFEQFKTEIGHGDNAKYLENLFEKTYLKHQNLANATQFLVNELFGKYGLIIVNADNFNLKQAFIPFAKKELLKKTSFKKVSETISNLKDYAIQVNPREINLFYIQDNLRERILFENGVYKINNTAIEFTENEILNELELKPEKFSPNVITRPLYQEIILPNLCYVGGGGELAYWFELKSNFDENNITFPILLLRNSAVLVSTKQIEKSAKLKISISDLFSKKSDLINAKTKQLSDFQIDLSSQKEIFKKQFEGLHQISELTDKSFSGAVKAEEIRQINGLNRLEKRLLKAQKRKFYDNLERINNLQNELFPNQSLQERTKNFSEFYLLIGEALIPKLMEKLKPLSNNFEIIEY